MTCTECEHLGIFGRGSMNFLFCKHPSATKAKNGKVSYKTILDVDAPVNCPNVEKKPIDWEAEYQKKIQARLSKKRKRY